MNNVPPTQVDGQAGLNSRLLSIGVGGAIPPRVVLCGLDKRSGDGDEFVLGRMLLLLLLLKLVHDGRSNVIAHLGGSGLRKACGGFTGVLAGLLGGGSHVGGGNRESGRQTKGNEAEA